jgi:hypothetical protein
MKYLIDIFSQIINRQSIPKKWCGTWADKDGKKLIIEPTRHKFYIINVLDPKGQPFQIDLLLEEKTKKTTNLIGRFSKDTNNNSILEVEAGINDIGPTFNLYFLTVKQNGKLRPARNLDNLKDIVIKPDVGMGLYDDWEDDLGVPWAFPLNNYRKTK